MPDISEQLAAQVESAYASKQPISIQGSNSKSFLRLQTSENVLDTTGHHGIIDYEPTELVITVRAGTTIATINETLSNHNQMLAFDPPQFGGHATIGGALACGLSGPARPWLGACRDFVLGSRIISGKGDVMKFGGQVMKNVAGYDVSRLMAGAFGTLGVILDISFKVLPKPEHVQTQKLELSADEAIASINKLSLTPIPISGAAWVNNHLYIRLSGHSDNVSQAVSQIGGETTPDNALWQSLRDHEYPFFTRNRPVWRIGIAPASPALDVEGEWLIEWGGAQRWLISDVNSNEVIHKITSAGGHYGLWYDSSKKNLRQPLTQDLLKLHRSLKSAFDPAGILNPNAFHPEF